MFYVLGYDAEGQLMLLTRRAFPTQLAANNYRDSVHVEFRAFVAERK